MTPVMCQMVTCSPDPEREWGLTTGGGADTRDTGNTSWTEWTEWTGSMTWQHSDHHHAQAGNIWAVNSQKKRKFHHQLLFSWENPHYLWHKSCQHFIFSFYIPHMFASQAPRPDVVGPCDHHRVKSVWLCLGVSRGKWILCWCSSVWQILWVQRWRGLWKLSGAIFFIINMI